MWHMRYGAVLAGIPPALADRSGRCPSRVRRCPHRRIQGRQVWFCFGCRCQVSAKSVNGSTLLGMLIASRIPETPGTLSAIRTIWFTLVGRTGATGQLQDTVLAFDIDSKSTKLASAFGVFQCCHNV